MAGNSTLFDKKTDMLTHEQFCEILRNLILHADLLETEGTEKREDYTAVIKHHAYQLYQLIECNACTTQTPRRLSV